MAVVMADDVEWAYSVTIRNKTPDVFDDIVIFYATKGSSGVTYLHSGTVGPGDTKVFDLGPCGAMSGYSMGVFIGNNMVIKFPAQGNMTRELATQNNPTDRFICEDSWAIE